MLSIYGRADRSPDGRDRTKKYLMHDYRGHSRSLASASRESRDPFFLSALVGFKGDQQMQKCRQDLALPR